MSEKKSKKKEKEEQKPSENNKIVGFFKSEKTRVSFAFLLILFAIFLGISFFSYLFTWKADQSKLSLSSWGFITDSDFTVENWTGKAGALFSHAFLYRWFGLPSFAFLFLLILVAFKLLKIKLMPVRRTTLYVLFVGAWLSIFLGYLAGQSDFYPGGAYGYFMSKWLNASVGKTGTFFILILTGFVFAIFAFHQFYVWIKQYFNKSVNQIKQGIESKKTHESLIIDTSRKKEEVENSQIQDNEIDLSDDELSQEVAFELFNRDNDNQEDVESEIIPDKKKGVNDLVVESVKNEEEKVSEIIRDENPENWEDYDPRRDLSNYKFPTLDLLHEYDVSKAEVSEEELMANKNKIIETLGHYGISIVKIKATIGPTVTLYEIVPAPGVKISKIRNLEDDIALSLAALGIRIIAPIPGKGTIGIEVPNIKAEIVPMKSVLASQRFQEIKAELPIAMGKTIQNETFVFDLAKAPHLLVAGATGQGKSVGLNAILTSLLYKKHPAEMKFVLIDPKKVEFPPYSLIERHYLAKLPEEAEAIITDTKKVIATLRSLTVEMDSRYDLLKLAGTRNIKEYNEKFIKRRLNPEKGHRYLPYFVVVIDEFADLIQTAGREVEDPIARIAQLARAVGIHLIIATQRPSTNVITGSIKANFPARIAFKVPSMIDSRTILDSPGANQLIGRGDMLISLGSDMVRVQCAFIDTDEVEKLAEFIGEQQGYPSAFNLPEVAEDNSDKGFDLGDGGKRDDMFEEAARLIVQNQQGSTSLIQRKFSIGYNRAGRIMDQLEAAGIVGTQEGSKARNVLYSDLYALEQYLNQLNS